MKETRKHREEREYKEREYIEQLFQQVKREAQQAGILFSSHISGIVINRRARKRFGCCKAVKSFAGYTSYQIEVAEKILICNEKKIKQTIAHELIHTCKGCMNHGERWKYYAMIMNRRYGYEIKRTATDEEMGVYTSSSSEEYIKKQENYKYRIICTQCGYIFYRKRMSEVVKHPENYRCGKCGGTLRKG